MGSLLQSIHCQTEARAGGGVCVCLFQGSVSCVQLFLLFDFVVCVSLKSSNWGIQICHGKAVPETQVYTQV